jgi:glycosyltransferase involved in cell wall biosynthesis
MEELKQVKREHILENVNFVTTVEKRTAGENRNIGFQEAQSDYICFLDADDTYSSHRLELLNKVISDTEAELIYHDYFRLVPRAVFSINRSMRAPDLVTTDELAAASFSDEGIQKNLDTTKGGYTNMLLPHRLRRMHRIQHGHVTVRTSITERFSTMTVGEDGEFARRCLMNKRKVIYIPQRLSIYDRATPSNLFSSFCSTTVSALVKLKLRTTMTSNLR